MTTRSISLTPVPPIHTGVVSLTPTPSIHTRHQPQDDDVLDQQ
jgi:hypothetical protein